MDDHEIDEIQKAMRPLAVEYLKAELVHSDLLIPETDEGAQVVAKVREQFTDRIGHPVTAEQWFQDVVADVQMEATNTVHRVAKRFVDAENRAHKQGEGIGYISSSAIDKSSRQGKVFHAGINRLKEQGFDEGLAELWINSAIADARMRSGPQR